MIRQNRFYVIIILILFFTLTIHLPRVEALQEAGELSGDIISFTLNAENEVDEVLAEGNALLSYGELQIEGRTARFNNKTGKLKMEEEIKVSYQDFLLQGAELEGNLEEESFRISGGTSLTGNDLVITADNLLYNQLQGEVVFENNTSLKYKEIEAAADKITYNLEENKVVLKGNVRGVRDGQHFTAEEMTISEGKVNLSGRASLKFADRGEE